MNIIQYYDRESSLELFDFNVSDINNRKFNNFHDVIKYLENNFSYYNNENSNIILAICKKIENSSSLYKERLEKIRKIAEKQFKSPLIINEEPISLATKRQLPEITADNPAKKIKITSTLSHSDQMLLEKVLQTNIKNKNLKELFKTLQKDLALQNRLWRESQNAQGDTILHFLSHFDKETAKEIIAGVQNIDIRNPKNGKTPLHVVYKKPELVQLLLENGADIHQRDKSGKNILYYAFSRKAYETLDILIQYKPSLITKMDFIEDAPILSAILIEDVKLLQLALKLYTNLSLDLNEDHLIYAAVSAKDERILKILLDQGISIDSSPAESASALFLACIEENIEAVKKLVQAGANVNAYNAEGENPLIIATGLGNEELFDYLVNHGADIQQKTRDNQSLIAIAESFNQISMIEKLISLGLK